MSDTERVGTPRWMELRASAVARAGGRCEACRRPCSLLCLKVANQAHGPELTLEDVTAVCAGCLHGDPPKHARARMTFRRSRG